MKVGSLFSGIGGFDLGLERAGMTIKWQVENDPFCNRVLAKHWPGVPRFGDIRECGAQNLATVDLICGGFPCQPYSIAGKRQGQADDRDLWPEMFRVISELRPAWVLCENVTAIDGMALDDCLSDLEAAGYETAPPLEIPACAVNAPHIRQRVWIVAYAQCFRTSGRQFGGPQQIDKTNESELRRENWWARLFPNSQILQWPEIFGSEQDGVLQEDVANSGCRNARECSNRNEVSTKRHGKEKTANTISGSGGDVADTDGNGKGCAPEGIQTRQCKSGQNGWWEFEPDVGRVAHGVPARVDRLRSLGNAVVPQLVEIIGRAIDEQAQPKEAQT